LSQLNLLAPAKINLTLEILGKRPDQFHDLTSIIVSVNLCDEIKIEESSELEIFCSNMLIKKESNLAYLVANALRNQYKISTGAKITLSKNIPVAAGLGGGSSDAATTLIGLNYGDWD
jgi:4-diphosphocytidyl-2-C-methyl-D-erythritol kinase